MSISPGLYSFDFAHVQSATLSLVNSVDNVSFIGKSKNNMKFQIMFQKVLGTDCG